MSQEIFIVNGDHSIEEIQSSMSKHYPYLRFEFYKLGFSTQYIVSGIEICDCGKCVSFHKHCIELDTKPLP